MIHTIYSLKMHKIQMCLYTGSPQKTYYKQKYIMQLWKQAH